MQEWISHPGVQAGLVPFVVALAIAAAFARTRALAVAALAGIVAVLALTIGFAVEPFTSVQKALVAVFALGAVAVALDLAGVAARPPVRGGLAVAAGALAVWSIGRVLARQEGATPWLGGAAAFAFVAALLAAALAAGAASSLRAAVVGAVLGWGAGVLALLGASALLAQIGLAVGSASAGVALVQLVRGRESPLGWSLVVPAATTAGLVGTLASATGELKAWTLAPLLLVPAAAHWATPKTRRQAPLGDGGAGRLWLLAVRIGVATLAVAAASVFIAWRAGQAAAA